MSEEIKERIADLMKINLSHKNINADLRKEIKYLEDRVNFYQGQCDQLKKENRQLRNMGKDFIDEHRNKGDM
jgi:cupin superfamily acireductone dioxygenase involved in methionine salvage|tara:strand:- start:17 stop:232 length:216 start_codon:yes stop_codon:yes gene_type:complete